MTDHVFRVRRRDDIFNKGQEKLCICKKSRVLFVCFVGHNCLPSPCRAPLIRVDRTSDTLPKKLWTEVLTETNELLPTEGCGRSHNSRP